ncbi:MAG: hypothetical protein P1P84_13505, partial [Deferrisomatales bacterium]|nr:hypothetical protein [Deferrisomatales bacterium]
MRIKIVTLAAVVVGAASLSATAAINPASPGLPGQNNATPWTSAQPTTYGYSPAPAALTGNPSSTMCVECHGVNPSARVMGPAYDGVPYRGGTYATARTD